MMAFEIWVTALRSNLRTLHRGLDTGNDAAG